MEPHELASQPRVIQEYEKCMTREAWAFTEWKQRLYEKIQNNELPVSVRDQIESYTILDMFDDMKAHSLRKATANNVASFQEEFSNIPPASRRGVLMWSNRLAMQDGGHTYNV